MEVYEQVDLLDMEFDEIAQAFFYPCPCGDLFSITIEALEDGEEIASCPSCSLVIRVLYDPADFEDEDQLPALMPIST